MMMSKTKMVPVPKDLAAEQIGVGIHTGYQHQQRNGQGQRRSVVQELPVLN